MLRMTVLSTVLLASSAVAGPQAATTASAPPASPATAPQAPAADPSSTCAYLTVSQGEIPESRDIFPKLRRAFEAPTKLRVPVDVEVREDLHEMQQIVKNGEYSYSARRTAEEHEVRDVPRRHRHRDHAAGPAEGL